MFSKISSSSMNVTWFWDRQGKCRYRSLRGQGDVTVWTGEERERRVGDEGGVVRDALAMGRCAGSGKTGTAWVWKIPDRPSGSYAEREREMLINDVKSDKSIPNMAAGPDE
jgi:hypothetical protein